MQQLHCSHNIPETKKGSGPCEIEWEVKKRNGKPNWWCRTHGLDASAPDGGRLDRCSGDWFTAVSEEMQADLDVASGEFALWGVVPPAIAIGDVPGEPGKVHVHHRPDSKSKKDVDRSFDIVRIKTADGLVVVEGMAAQASAVSELMSMSTTNLKCPRCGEEHIDELMFATRPHIKHQCNGCGRNFRDKAPSISNPLAQLQTRCGLPEQATIRPHRPLEIRSEDYKAIAIWPSNRAILSTMTRPEDEGLHVHAWKQSTSSKPTIDDTYSEVTLDGVLLEERLVRMLSVQRALASSKTPIVSLDCVGCGQPILSPVDGWMQPATRHVCGACGAENRTMRRSFVNPLVDKLKP